MLDYLIGRAIDASRASLRTHLLKRADESLRRRRVHELEVQQVVDAQALEKQHHVAHVRPLDLGNGVVLELVLEGPGREKTEALPGLRPSGPSGPVRTFTSDR